MSGFLGAGGGGLEIGGGGLEIGTTAADAAAGNKGVSNGDSHTHEAGSGGATALQYETITLRPVSATDWGII